MRRNKSGKQKARQDTITSISFAEIRNFLSRLDVRLLRFLQITLFGTACFIFTAGGLSVKFGPKLINLLASSSSEIEQVSNNPPLLLENLMAEFVDSDHIGIDLGKQILCDRVYMKLYNQKKTSLDRIEALARESGREEILYSFVNPQRPMMVNSTSDCSSPNFVN